MDIRQTQIAIKQIKDCFQEHLAKELNLLRVSAPLFVRPESGLNDDLSGVEVPVQRRHAGEEDICAGVE